MDNIKKYIIGNPFETNAVVKKISVSEELPLQIEFSTDKRVIKYVMGKEDKIYGLGEAVRGINKRGWIYETYCSDDPMHTETKA